MRKIDRTGEVKENLNGLEMKIIEYKNNKEVRVLFTASGETRLTTYLKFKQGKVYPTWKNKTYNKSKYITPTKSDVYQDIRDIDIADITLEDYDEPSSNLAIALAMAIGSIALIGGIIALIGWLC